MSENMALDSKGLNSNEANKNEPRLQGVNRTTVVTPVKSAIDAIQALNNVSTISLIFFQFVFLSIIYPVLSRDLSII
jgi:hypothetical protein|tara:strand:- start:1851 stop:2081 length:231 start_codon:yes stop_codon:yes gene_type:complete